MAERTQGKYPSQFEKVKEITDKLEAGVVQMMNSDSFKNYLKVMARFHNYSLNNTILIALQDPKATLIAGYTAWQKNFGRQVMKGEKAIRILAPTPYKKKMEVAVIDPSTGQARMNPMGLKRPASRLAARIARFRLSSLPVRRKLAPAEMCHMNPTSWCSTSMLYSALSSMASVRSASAR